MDLRTKFSDIISDWKKKTALSFFIAHIGFFAAAAAVLIVGAIAIYLLYSVEDWALWRDARKDGENANNAAANANRLEGERERIKAQANADLGVIKQQGSQTNANLSNSLNNLNQLNNRNFNQGSGADLDREADEYRKRPGRNNKW